MIIGNGMIAKALQGLSFDSVLIFASGVSDSGCCSEIEFKKERDLFRIQDHLMSVYFSTITVLQEQKTPYILHKIAMEEMVRLGPHLILRFPNLIGPEQCNKQLIPSLIRQIQTGKVNIQKNATRCILDVITVADIVSKFLKKEEQGTFNIFGRPISIEDLVSKICQILGANPKINYVEATDYPTLKPTIRLENDYYSKILTKYLPAPNGSGSI